MMVPIVQRLSDVEYFISYVYWITTDVFSYLNYRKLLAQGFIVVLHLQYLGKFSLCVFSAL